MVLIIIVVVVVYPLPLNKDDSSADADPCCGPGILVLGLPVVLLLVLLLPAGCWGAGRLVAVAAWPEGGAPVGGVRDLNGVRRMWMSTLAAEAGANPVVFLADVETSCRKAVSGEGVRDRAV